MQQGQKALGETLLLGHWFRLEEAGGTLFQVGGSSVSKTLIRSHLATYSEVAPRVTHISTQLYLLG